jgi:RNA polymerase sigma-70 factor, ECF subfamily
MSELGTERQDTSEKEERWCVSTIGVQTKSPDNGSDASLPRIDLNERPANQNHEWQTQIDSYGNCEISSARATHQITLCQAASDATLAAYVQMAKERRQQLVWLAQRITRNRDEAEDVVQEALLRAFKSLPQFRGESQMATWLGVIVLNAAREWLRNQKGKQWISFENTHSRDEGPIEIEIRDPSRNPEQNCIRNEIDSILHSAIDRLSSVSRSALRICVLEEESHESAAKMMGVRVSTIKSRVFRGKNMLRRTVGGGITQGKEWLRSFELAS